MMDMALHDGHGTARWTWHCKKAPPTFHSRAVRSLDTVSALSCLIEASRHNTSLWCPNRESTYAISDTLHSFTLRSVEVERSSRVLGRNAREVTAPRWPANACSSRETDR